jgi:hypothetical protein
MKFTAKEVVRGISNMTYNIDGQQAQTKVAYIEVALDAAHGGKGTRTDAVQVAEAEVLKQIEHNTFPMLAELEFEQRATKNKTQLVIVGIKPLKTITEPKAA